MNVAESVNVLKSLVSEILFWQTKKNQSIDSTLKGILVCMADRKSLKTMKLHTS